MSDVFDDLIDRQALPGEAARIAAVIAPISLKSKSCCRTGIQTCETSARSASPACS